MTELGGEGRCHAENVEFEINGLRNLMKFLGIIEGKLENLPSKYLIYEGFWMHSQTGGIFRSNVHLRQEVRK